MTKMLLAVAVVIALSAIPAMGQNAQGDRVVRVQIDTPAELDQVLSLTDDVWSERVGVGGPVDVRLSPDAYRTLVSLNLEHEVLINNLGDAIDAHMQTVQQHRAIVGLGYFENYHTYSEIRSYVDALGAAHPDLVHVSVVGQSLEGRDIFAVQITGPGDASQRPQVAINGTQHAREWISTMTVTYAIDQLVAGYGVDPEITELLDNVSLHFVPIVNADGYVFSWTDNRLWRKNRRFNGTCYGVDLNRNWPYGWGGEGSSGNQCQEVYRGTAPLSEPETAAMVDYLGSLDRLAAHIDFHSYGQWILSPWDYTSDLPPDATLFDLLNAELHEAIYDVHGEFYTAGPGYETLYPAAGSLPDTVYGTLGALSWTIEVRPIGNPGFLLPPEEILPTAEENFAAVLTLADAVRSSVLIAAASTPDVIPPDAPYPISADIYELSGTVDTASLMVRAEGDQSFVAVPMQQDGFTYTGLIAAQDCGTTVEFFVQVNTTDGDVVTYPQGGANAPLTAEVLQENVLVEDDAEMDAGWVTGAQGDTADTGIWERADPEGTAAQPGDDHTPGGTDCYVTGAEAGGGLGSNDIDGGFMTLITPVYDLSQSPEAQISYWRWYSNGTGAEPHTDVFVVDISSDGGATWTNVETVGPGGDGTNGGWLRHAFTVADITDVTDQIQVRFIAEDDPGGGGSLVEAAIDDLQVFEYECQCPDGADFNGDGQLNVLDFIAYQESFGAGDTCADINGDGALDILDFIAFQVLFSE